MPSIRTRRLTPAQARRVAIDAQGLAAPRPASPDLGHMMRAVRRLGVLQIDSVNVVERAHHLTLFSRLGPHDPALLWRAMEERRVFEYWARMASFSPMEHFPLFRHRMERRAEGNWAKLEELRARAPGYVEDVYRQVAERGPLTTSDLDDPGERDGPWWGWADGKVALEYLFSAGRITVAYRRNFTRYYDLVERVVPPRYLDAMPDAEVARTELLAQAARALGIGTARDLIDYYRIPVAEGRPLLNRLVREGHLVPAEVEGWSQPVYLHAGVTVPRATHARALVNPFDPFMWNRERIERFHGFQYRIEIYVPEAKRTHGYYVFPFLLDDELVARVDLKADRRAGVLRVPGAFLEDGHDSSRVARELAGELGEMATWLGLGEISVGGKGDLATPLRRVV